MAEKNRGEEKGLEKVELKRTLGLFSGCAVIMGTIIGSGIFVSPKGVLMYSGSVGMSLIVWAVCGFLSLLGALCYAEIGVLVPKSGGAYAYLKEAYGNWAGFLYMWAFVIIIMPAGNAVIAMTFGYYVLQPIFPWCSSPLTAVILLAAAAITVLTYVNCVSVKVAARVQGVFGIIKMIALILVAGCGLVFLCMGRVENLQNPFEGSNNNAGMVSLAFYSAIFSYAGWDSLNFLVEELKNPYRNLPLAILISISTCTVVYVLTNLAYFVLLSPGEIMASQAVAVTFAVKVFSGIAWVMSFLVACSTFGSLNGCLMCIGRVCYAGARDGNLPTFLSLIHMKKFTPLPAIMFQGVVSMAMLLFGDVWVLINIASFMESLTFLCCVSTLFVFRYTMPKAPRPIKVHLIIPIIFLLISAFILVMSIITKPRDTGFGLIILASGVPFYCVGVLWKKKPVTMTSKLEAITRLVQKITLGCPEDL